MGVQIEGHAAVHVVLEAHSQLNVMIPSMVSLKSAMRALITAETALSQHLRELPDVKHDDLMKINARIVSAQLELQQQVDRLSGETVVLRSTLPQTASATLVARMKNCPPSAMDLQFN